MKTLAISNQKGGAGKTTTAINLSACLAEKGRRVLLIDLDPQACASAWCGVRDGGRGLLEALTDNADLGDLVVPTKTPGLELVPSSSWLANVDKALAGEVGAELILRDRLAALPQRWDVVVIDCPPALGLLTVSALAAVRDVLVPVEASVMTLAGLARLSETVDVIRRRLNPDLALSAVLACRVDLRRNLAREVLESMRKTFGQAVLQAVVRENVRLAEAWSYAQPITTYDTTSRGAEDYRAVADELLTRWRKRP